MRLSSREFPALLFSGAQVRQVAHGLDGSPAHRPPGRGWLLISNVHSMTDGPMRAARGRERCLTLCQAHYLLPEKARELAVFLASVVESCMRLAQMAGAHACASEQVHRE